jgi:hypothetical protein
VGREIDLSWAAMNFLYKAAVIWVLSLLAAGPIPLAVHVAVCHDRGDHCASSESDCSHHHHHGAEAGHSHAQSADHSHAGDSHTAFSDSANQPIALLASDHDHDCGVCHTLSQTASTDSVHHDSNSQLIVHPSSIALSDVYDVLVCTSYQVRGPPCSLLV